ncbi:hypothetical protein WN943_003177 [Citrus x changshan-huyou]
MTSPASKAAINRQRFIVHCQLNRASGVMYANDVTSHGLKKQLSCQRAAAKALPNTLAAG